MLTITERQTSKQPTTRRSLVNSIELPARMQRQRHAALKCLKKVTWRGVALIMSFFGPMAIDELDYIKSGSIGVDSLC